MPSTSPAQAHLMRAVAHGWKPSKGGPPVSVAKEFVAADKAKGTHMMKKGGMKAMKPRLPAALAAQSMPPPNAAAGPVTDGQPGVPGMKHGGKTKKMKEGGETVKSEQGPVRKWKEEGEEKDAKGKEIAMKRGGTHKKFAGGGKVRGDGIAERGRTRGRFV